MYRIGVDLGGTNISAGVIDDKLEIIGRGKLKTNCPREAELILADVAKAVELAAADAGIGMKDVVSIGIGTPGSVNKTTGYIEYANNLDFDKVPAKQILEARLKKTVYLDNDANCAALGEAVAGVGRGVSSFVAITLGTGVGGGIIVDGKIVAGANGAGGEIGHIHIEDNETEECGCKNKGCLEQYASATGIVRLAKRRLAKDDKPSVLREGTLSAKSVFDAVKAGDEVAMEIAGQFGEYLGKGLAAVAGVVNPEVFVIGGGVSKAGEILISYVEPWFQKYAFQQCRGAKFALAKLGNDAGIFGAAGLILR